MTEKETPSVLICCPMSYKVILPDERPFFTGIDWIASVSAQDYPNARIFVLANDLTASMVAELTRACADLQNIGIKYIETGDPPDNRVRRRKFDKEKKQEPFTRFANIRNMVLDHFLAGDWDYMVSIDSDVMVHPECVTNLVTVIRNKPGYGVIAAIVNNTRRKGMERKFNKAIYNFGNIVPFTGRHKRKKEVGRCNHIRKFQRGQFIDVDYTGACEIIDGKMLRENPDVRWGAQKGGEDLFFCTAVKESGFKIGVDTTIVTLHQMDDIVYLEDREVFQRGDFV